MAVLIEKTWISYGHPESEEEVRIAAAILPSGKVLTKDDDEAPFGTDRVSLEGAVKEYQLAGYSEAEMFDRIYLEYTSMSTKFFLVEDPREARKIIKEAGLTATLTPRERAEYRSLKLPENYFTAREQSDGDQE